MHIRSTVAGCAVAACLAAVLTAGVARADPREDFLAGHSRACQKCDLAGASLKRRDLAGVDLSGANLRGANFHDAQLAGARLAGSRVRPGTIAFETMIAGAPARMPATNGGSPTRRSLHHGSVYAVP